MKSWARRRNRSLSGGWVSTVVDGGRERRDVAHRNKGTVAPVLEDLTRAARAVRADDRAAAGHCLDQHGRAGLRKATRAPARLTAPCRRNGWRQTRRIDVLGHAPARAPATRSPPAAARSFAIAPGTEDDQPHMPLSPDHRECPDQARIVLLRGQAADREDHRRLAGSEPGMITGAAAASSISGPTTGL